MKKKLIYLIGLSLVCSFLLPACGSAPQQAAGETPEETIDLAFTALKEVDLETFNACTNNKHNGQYRLFDDLLRRKNTATNQQLAQAVVENLSWEINEVQVDGDTAVAQVTVQNKDFSDAVGLFIADLIQEASCVTQEDANLSDAVRQAIDKTRNISECLLPYIQNSDKHLTTTLSIQLANSENGWKIQLDDMLCNTITGNMGSQEISEQVRMQLEATEELLNRNLERWGYHVENSAEQWADDLNEKIGTIFQ